MDRSRRSFAIGAAGLLAGAAIAGPALAQGGPIDKLTEGGEELWLALEGFWSLTMYDENYFFVENPLNRYSISARQDLKASDDGSVDILIQHESPGADKESNWLPAPEGRFVLMMRLYWPDEGAPSILDGSWAIPAAKRVG